MWLFWSQFLGSRRLRLQKTAHFLPLQQNKLSRAGGALLALGQWEGEKEGTSFGCARRMNATAQTTDQFTDDR
jgi:hypothetical protein